jgi:RimJ/RimL family protein N-acetyltransferase
MLQTPRLDLVPAGLGHLEAELRGPGFLADLLGAKVPGDWPPGEYDRGAIAFFRARLLEGGTGVEAWYSWYGITRDGLGRRDCLVAAAGFFGPPARGRVEIGYSVVPSARGRGFAGEMVGALVARAFGDPEVGEVVAHTSRANLPSIRLLAACGFEVVGPGDDPGMDRYLKRRIPLN